MLATAELCGQVYLCMKRQWFMLALQELPHRDGAAASLSLLLRSWCSAVRQSWLGRQPMVSGANWRACVPACLRVCVPACLRVRVSAWLGQACVHAWADVEKILFY